ncbi:MAG: acetylornithine transaminase [Actinomycetota bacterium]
MRGLIETYKRKPVEFVRGEGEFLFDADGRRYVDLLGGIAVALLGHAHPQVTAAITAQASQLVHVSNLFYTRPGAELASRLFDLTGMNGFFVNSGAEAVECALKLARRWAGDQKPTSTPKVIATDGGFHGRTFGALSVTGQPPKRQPFEPLVPGAMHVPYGDVTAVEAAFDDDVIAVVVEPIQGEAGVVVPPTGYLRALRQICDENHALLIVDEVQTGLGRTGTWFAYQQEFIEPDIVCLAKGLANGLPIGVCLAKPAVGDAFRAGDHGTTFGGGPVQCAAAMAVLDTIEKEALVARAAELGEVTKARLRSIFGPEIEVRGKGLMIGIELGGGVASTFADRCLEAGVVVNDAGPDVIRLLPPLTIGDEVMADALDTVGEVWEQMSSSRS